MKPFIDECGIIHIAYMATAMFLSKEVVTTSAHTAVILIKASKVKEMYTGEIPKGNTLYLS